jgi:septation ring formation regulator EzrA
MALAKEDVEQIQAIVLQTINNTPEFKNANVRYEIDLRERTIRVEEELKHQRELMQEGFKQMEKRFEQVDKRFEQVEKRFEQIDKRFEQVDKRFEQMSLGYFNITCLSSWLTP